MTPVAAELSRATGIALGSFRTDYLAERVRRALEREGLADAHALVRLIHTSTSVRERFRRSVAVSVSGLFRDPEQFELLRTELLPPLLHEERPIRVWSAGCADGSELYSVATLLELAGALETAVLLGSDLLEENLATARRGIYREQVIPPAVRARARWEQRDLVADGAPDGTWTLILCRNVAIYLAPDAKRALHRTLAGALRPGGILLIGKAERVTNPTALGLERAGPHAYRRRG